MSPAPWPDDGSPETTPIRFRAHATIMMKTPDRRKANSVEMRMPRAIEWACDAMLPISLCPSRWAVGPTSGMRLSVAPRWHAQLDATACGAGENLDRKHVLSQLRPFSHEEFPSSRRPSDTERLDADRTHRTFASDATILRRPNRCCHAQGEVIRSHLVLDREGLLRVAR